MPKRTLLDRSIVVVLPEPIDGTPSRLQGISSADERLHRLHGTGIVEQACGVLSLRDIYPTACVVFHRFFHQVSLTDADVWSIAMAATLLAAKTHEVPLPVRKLILAFAHVYRKHALLVLPDSDRRKALIEQHPAVVLAPAANRSLEEKKSELENNVPPMSQLGPVWKEWHNAVVQAEGRVLRQLGFTLYWIPDHHPHLFVKHFLLALSVADDSRFTAATYRNCNLACRLDLCVRLAAEVICCAAIYCAALELNFELPITEDDTSWWQVFCGRDLCEQDLSDAANAISGLADESNLDVVTASTAYLRSRLLNGSFIDPDSFLWDMLVGRMVAGKVN